ncbi:MAG TPA: hypothetical protein VMF30_16770 [Pirellulales bacterium]|nr:hypothetical protein [Pirellulales bacterium]
MKRHPWPLFFLLAACLGCQTAASGIPSDLCNVPGRQAVAQRIVARGGTLETGGGEWDGSVDATTRARMGQPISTVVLPQDRFNAGDVAEAQLMFPEAKISTPLTLEDAQEQRDEEEESDG